MQCENTGFCSQCSFCLISELSALCTLIHDILKCLPCKSPLTHPSTLMNSSKFGKLSVFAIDGNKFISQLN